MQLIRYSLNWKADLLKEITSKKVTKWNPFLKEKFINAIAKCNNLSTPDLDKLS